MTVAPLIFLFLDMVLLRFSMVIKKLDGFDLCLADPDASGSMDRDPLFVIVDLIHLF